jgi:starvation-inducible DNA-binding protein
MRPGFRKGLAVRELQGQLRDLLSLAVVGDHVRWVLKGDESEELADWLTEATALWRSWADQVAKHLVTLGVPPDGRVRSLAKDIPIQWVPDGWLGCGDAGRLIANRLGTIAAWTRYRRSQATASDTVRLFDAICVGLDAHAHAWSRLELGKSALEGRQNAAD